jgi:signal transduction histidine kinase
MSCFEVLPDSPSSTARRDQEVATASGQFYAVRRTPLSDASGATAGWILRWSDITAIKVAGRQQEQVLELLTHDMRSPQVSILALLDNAGEGAVPSSVASRIRRYARRTLALADNFVHMALADTSHYAFETISLGDILLEAVDDLWPQATAKGIEIEIREGPREYLVRSDRVLLTRALINLIDNAIKFTGEGGRVTCSLERRTASGREEHACVVSDNGCGMSQDQLSNLFQRFRRARAGANRRRDGVGLGLMLVQRVIARHGGAIDCESELGKGTSFTLTFPAWEEN